MAATGLIVLTTGFSTHDAVLVDRLFDTAIGIVVGLAVNLVVWPPLRDYSAARAIDAIDDGVGELLRDMADGLAGEPDQDLVTEWVDRTRDLDEDIDQAWAMVRQSKESGRLNPRRAAPDRADLRGLRGDPARQRAGGGRVAQHGAHARVQHRRAPRVGAGLPGALAGAAATRRARRSAPPTRPASSRCAPT